MEAGDTFFFKVDVDSHLWMIISDPSIDRDNVILVSFTTLTDEKEAVCVLNAGEHPRVKHATCVHYQKALKVSMTQLAELERKQLLDFQPRLSRELLQRIRNSAADSRRFPEEMYEVLLSQDLIEFEES
jgi:hypothetical protein